MDVLTPKQALFAKAMVERSPSNVELSITTRNYSELNKFVKWIRLRNLSLGRHGGASLEKKLEASIERMHDLVPFVLGEKFDASFSFISPEAARVSFGLGIPHYICSDSPHAKAPCKLAIPLSSKIFSPFPIDQKRWSQYGIESSRVLFYHALDPWAWLASRRKEKSKGKGRTNANQNLVTIRLEESFASYVQSGKGISTILSKLIQLIRKIGDFEIAVIPRYDEQRAWTMKEFGKICTVPSGVIDGADLVSKSLLMIGGGGTMTQEAALMGVPNISYFPSSNLDVFENYYFPKKLSVRASNEQELLKETRSLLSKINDERENFSKRASDAVSTFEDPVKFILQRVLEDL